MASCVDTVVEPVEKTIAEDYWKEQDDVTMMLAGAYKDLTTSAVIDRFLVWGELRSDNVNPNENITSNSTLTALSSVNTLNLDDKNAYCDWSAFYAAINKCNLVLDRAGDVLENDPSYTQGLYNVDRAQALALRAFAYFYLVRAFRDVPYSGVSFQNASQDMELPQAPADSILTLCLADLAEAESMALAYTSYDTWERYGLFTRDGVRALKADIHLWRASMNHNTPELAERNAQDYQDCVDLCKKIVDSRSFFVSNALSAQNKNDYIFSEDYGLYKGDMVYDAIFVRPSMYSSLPTSLPNGGSLESIFEIQFNATTYNLSVCQMYWQYKEKTTPGFLAAAIPFGTYDETNLNPVSTDHVFYSPNDYRFWSACFNVGPDNATAESYSVRKMVASTSPTSSNALKSQTLTGRADNAYSSYRQNWIAYRLSDVILMEAEALVQLAPDGAATASDANLTEALALVTAVNKRSLYDTADAVDNTATFGTYTINKEEMEKLVLAERRRELCFEGKRWFDLMRYSYRKMSGIDSQTAIVNQHLDKSKQKNGKTVMVADVTKFTPIPTELLTFLKAKFRDGGSALAFKLTTEPMLYMPVYNKELKVNPNLSQNPGFLADDEYEKNY